MYVSTSGHLEHLTPRKSSYTAKRNLLFSCAVCFSFRCRDGGGDPPHPLSIYPNHSCIKSTVPIQILLLLKLFQIRKKNECGKLIEGKNVNYNRKSKKKYQKTNQLKTEVVPQRQPDAMDTMPTLPIHAQANRSTVAGNNIFWQVTYQKAVPHHRLNDQAYKYCPICTLPYPCQHVDAKQHSLNTVERWKSYPSNPKSVRCVEFDSSGFCTSFATRNCCGFHHETEKKIAEFKIVDGRCKVCTLPSKSRCYIHDPPLGKKLCKVDRGIVVDGPNYEERFVVGEIVAVASAVSCCCEMFWIYSPVVLCVSTVILLHVLIAFHSVMLPFVLWSESFCC